MNNEITWWREMSQAYLNKAMSIGKTSTDHMSRRQKLLRLVAIKATFDMMSVCSATYWEMLKAANPRLATAQENSHNFGVKAEALERLYLPAGSKLSLIRDVAARSHMDVCRAESATFNQLYASVH